MYNVPLAMCNDDFLMERSVTVSQLHIPHSTLHTLMKGTDAMELSQEQYARMVQQASPSSSFAKDCFFAFLTGGLICTIGQVLTNIYQFTLGLSLPDARCFTSITLVATAAILTVLSLYDNIAKFAGAGTLVPITGFANAIVAPAIEFKSEGLIMGLGAKMFVIAGPVIVFGTVSSILYGLLLYFTQL